MRRASTPADHLVRGFLYGFLSGEMPDLLSKKKKMDKIKRRPWKVASFATQAEADACIFGIQAAIGGMLTSVAFVDDETALLIDRNVCTKLGITSSENDQGEEKPIYK